MVTIWLCLLILAYFSVILLIWPLLRLCIHCGGNKNGSANAPTRPPPLPLPPRQEVITIDEPPQLSRPALLLLPAPPPLPPPPPPVNEEGLKIFSYKEIETATSNFNDDRLLGEGGFGKVFKGDLGNGKSVAIKELNKGSRQGDREFKAEITTLGHIHHANLIKLIGYCIESGHRMLVYEFIPNNSLHSHLHGNDKPAVKWRKRYEIAIGTAEGLKYLHVHCDPKILHRDIKAANVLLDDNFQPKLADFGLAKFFPEGISQLVTENPKGTFGYIAPEALEGSLNCGTDVYAFGVLLLELITGKKPTDKADGRQNLAAWAKSLPGEALEKGKHLYHVDQRLKKAYDVNQVKTNDEMCCSLCGS